MKNWTLAFLIALSALLSSCARNLSSDFYASRQVGEASMTYPGVIQAVRMVVVGEGEYLGDNGVGLAGGGLAGGLIGSAAGRGHFLPTAAGAVAGAVTGALIEKKMKEQNAFEYIVQLYNGALMTVIQGLDQRFEVGQPVYVVVSAGGRSRIVPQ